MNPDEPGSESWMQRELEVRLVALLAGEASDFERAELERLMEEDPELKVFYRRIKAVNDLMAGASVDAPADADWRLSAERRCAVMHMLGTSEGPASAVGPQTQKPRRRVAGTLGKWTAVAAVLIVGLGLASLVTTTSRMSLKRPAIENRADRDGALSSVAGRDSLESPSGPFSATGEAWFTQDERKREAALPALAEAQSGSQQGEGRSLAAAKAPSTAPRPTAKPRETHEPTSEPADIAAAVQTEREGYAALGLNDDDGFGQISGLNTLGRQLQTTADQEGYHSVREPEVALNFAPESDWSFGVDAASMQVESRFSEVAPTAPQAGAAVNGTISWMERLENRDGDGVSPDGFALGDDLKRLTPKDAEARVQNDFLEADHDQLGLGAEEQLAQLRGALKDQLDKVEESRLKMLDQAERYRIVDLADLGNQADEAGETLFESEEIRQQGAVNEPAEVGAKAAQLRKAIAEGKRDDPMDEGRKIAKYSEASKRYEAEKLALQQMQESFAKEIVDSLPPSPIALPAAPATPRLAEPVAEEQNAEQTPFSTFSLHVSDVAFKLAKAALLENGTQPEAEKMRVEEFVNAFDYGDRVPTYDEQVACRIEQAAHPFLQQRNLLRVSMRTAALGRSSAQPLQLTLLLDNSGSMEREDRKASVLQAVALLAQQLTARDRVNLISFARQPQLRVEALSGDRAAELVEAVARTPVEGGTNLELALQLGSELARRHYISGGQNRVVILTDGAANLGDADPERLRALTRHLRESGIAVDACGVGANGLNDRMLEALTREADGRYYFLDRPEDADASFVQQVAGALRPAARNVKVQVRFNPERVGRYRLLGFEKHRLAKEDFRNDAVDAAEMAAAEAGVAVYQVEAKPEGQGPLGEVSVRYQEVASGRMVERRWEMPYEEKVARFDEAAPTLQLAGVAAFVGQKLKGGPEADQVRLSELSGVLTQLRGSYPNDPRVKDLVAMTAKLR